MNKYRPFIMASVFVLVLTLLVGSLYTIATNKTYSYIIDNTGSELTFNDVVIDTNLDTTYYDGPNIINGKVSVDLDMIGNDYFNFVFDINNTSGLDYKLNNIVINAESDVDINKNISVDLFYEDGTQVTRDTLVYAHTKRKVYAYIKYDKLIDTQKSFKLNIDFDYSPTIFK